METLNMEQRFQTLEKQCGNIETKLDKITEALVTIVKIEERLGLINHRLGNNEHGLQAIAAHKQECDSQHSRAMTAIATLKAQLETVKERQEAYIKVGYAVITAVTIAGVMAVLKLI